MSEPIVFPEMVERIARALANRHLEHVGGADGETLTKGQPNWYSFTYDAALVLRTIREPTEKMLLVDTDPEDSGRVWRKMADEALK